MKIRRTTTLALVGIALFVMLGVAGLGWHRQRAVLRSLDTLQELFDACRRYGSHQEPQQAIATMVRKGIIAKEQTIDPISGRPFKFNNLIRAEDIGSGGVFGYSPLAKLLLGNRKGGAVVFTDGHAEWLYQEQYEKTLAEILTIT